MKKIFGLLALFVAILTLAGCDKNVKPIATMENINIGRTTVSFNLNVDDKDVVAENSVMAKVYDSKDNLFTTKTITGFSGSISVTGLTKGTDYYVDILCTYDKKQKAIKSYKFKTLTTGSSNDPYVIMTAPELVEMLSTDYSSDVYYELGADIDFNDYLSTLEEGKTFSGLCTSSSKSFQGFFDGKGYTISNVVVDSTSNSYGGLFGYNKGTIKNLNLEDAEVSVKKTSSSTIYVGGLVGYNYQGIVSNVSIDGLELNAESTTVYAAGLVGYNYASNILDCNVANANLSITKATTTGYVGGLTAYNCQNSDSKYGRLNENKVDAAVEISNAYNVYYGGLVAYNKNGGTINKAIVNVDADIKAYGIINAGGLIGYSNVGSNADSARGNIQNVSVSGKIDYESSKYDTTLEVPAQTYVRTSALICIGGAVGNATAIVLDKAYINVDISAKINTDAKAYIGGVYGNGYNYYSAVTNSVYSGSVILDFENSADEAELFYDLFDAPETCTLENNFTIDSSVFDGSASTTSNTIASVTVEFLTDELGFDEDVWTITVVEGEYVLEFK